MWLCILLLFVLQCALLHIFIIFKSRVYVGRAEGPLDMQDPSLIYASGTVIPEALAFPRTVLCSLKALSAFRP